MRKHIVMFSGGVGSWATAKRVVTKEDRKNVILVFADTLIEDEDLYRFLEEAAADIGAPLVKVAEGRTPWEVFRDERFIGNSRADPCSKILKRKFLRRWLEDNADPNNATIYLGIDWTESHRFESAKLRWNPWQCAAPLLEPPYLFKEELLSSLQQSGIQPPRLYQLGFPHNNCGGFCIKAGQAHFKLLLSVMPERFAFHEEQERALGEYLGKQVSILRDRTGGRTRPLPLSELRERINQGQVIDELEWGGCGCIT